MRLVGQLWQAGGCACPPVVLRVAALRWWLHKEALQQSRPFSCELSILRHKHHVENRCPGLWRRRLADARSRQKAGGSRMRTRAGNLRSCFRGGRRHARWSRVSGSVMRTRRHEKEGRGGALPAAIQLEGEVDRSRRRLARCDGVRREMQKEVVHLLRGVARVPRVLGLG